MEKRILEKAEKDIIAIKDIINETTDTLISISRIFVGWGLVFIAFCAIIIPFCLLRYTISDFIRSNPVTTIIPLILVAFASLITYLIIYKTKGFKGLSKPLLAVWQFIIVYVTAFPAVEYLLANQSYNNTDIDISLSFSSYLTVDTLLLLLAFGLLCIRLFTNLKFIGTLSAIYTIFALLYMILPYYIFMGNDKYFFTITIISYCAIMPVTFLILGGYLEFYRIRRNKDGYKFHT